MTAVLALALQAALVMAFARMEPAFAMQATLGRLVVASHHFIHHTLSSLKNDTSSEFSFYHLPWKIGEIE